jgi:Holliday junction resolvasome RuvABC endonuclease subunit
VISMGLDLSSSATGVVVLQDRSPAPLCQLEYEFRIDDVTGVKKQRAICTTIMTLIHAWKPDKIVVEGYSLNLKNKSSIIPLVELGGLLRFCLQLDGLAWSEPTASQLKKFVTGSGNSDKAKVMMGVLKRWGHESKTNNTADAFVLAAMGLAAGNKLDGMTQEMYAVSMNLPSRTN